MTLLISKAAGHDSPHVGAHSHRTDHFLGAERRGLECERQLSQLRLCQSSLYRTDHPAVRPEELPAIPFSASIEEHDKLVIQTGKRIEALALLRPDDHPAPCCLYFERMPLYDRRGNRTGVIAHAKTLTSVAPRGFIATDGIGTFTFTPPRSCSPRANGT